MEERGNQEREYAADMPEWRAVQLGSVAPPPLFKPYDQAATGPTVDLTSSKLTSQPLKVDLDFKVPALPSYYRLEKTAGVIKDIPLRTITERIAENLRLNSVTTSFHPKEGNVECLSLSQLEFCIQLWQKKVKIIVEVQRVQGSTSELYSFCKQLFNAIRTGKQSVEVPVVRALPVKDELDCVDGNLNEAFTIMHSLIESPKLDQVRLGLESLNSLTDPAMVGKERAHAVSRAFVFAEGSDGERLQVAVAPYFSVERKSLFTAFSATQDESTSSLFSDRSMHHLALKALCNALQVVENELVDLDISNVYLEKIIACLCNNIRLAEHRPQEASCATKCIRMLSACVGVKASSYEGIVQAVERAERIGKISHATLEKESRSLLVSQFVK